MIFVMPLLVAAALVVLVMLKLRNAAFPLPVAWAYFGIHQYLKAPNGFQGQYGTAEVAALIGIPLLLCAAAYQFYRNRYTLLPAAGK